MGACWGAGLSATESSRKSDVACEGEGETAIAGAGVVAGAEEVGLLF